MMDLMVVMAEVSGVWMYAGRWVAFEMIVSMVSMVYDIDDRGGIAVAARVRRSVIPRPPRALGRETRRG